MTTCPHCDAPNQAAPSCAYCGGVLALREPAAPPSIPVLSSIKEPTATSPADSGEFIIAPAAAPASASLRLNSSSTSRAAPLSTPAAAPARASSTVDRPAAARDQGIAVPAAAAGSVRIPEFAARRPPAAPSRPAAPAPASFQHDQPRQGAHERSVASTPPRSGPLRRESWKRTIQVSARKLAMPPMCACCLREPSGNAPASHVRLHGRGTTGSERSWMFPICAACQHHVRAGRISTNKSRLVAGLAFVIPVAACSLLGVWLAGVLIGAVTGLVAGIAAQALQRQRVAALASPTCACLGPAVRFERFHGTIQTFRFANEHYAAAFERANASKIVDHDPSSVASPD